jgi:hypothetical protein
MARKYRSYAPEFRREMVELIRAGRTPQELAKEFEPSAQAIRNWFAQADRDEGRSGGLAPSTKLTAAGRRALPRSFGGCGADGRCPKYPTRGCRARGRWCRLVRSRMSSKLLSIRLPQPMASIVYCCLSYASYDRTWLCVPPITLGSEEAPASNSRGLFNSSGGPEHARSHPVRCPHFSWLRGENGQYFRHRANYSPGVTAKRAKVVLRRASQLAHTGDFQAGFKSRRC